MKNLAEILRLGNFTLTLRKPARNSVGSNYAGNF